MSLVKDFVWNKTVIGATRAAASNMKKNKTSVHPNRIFCLCDLDAIFCLKYKILKKYQDIDISNKKERMWSAKKQNIHSGIIQELQIKKN